MWPWEHAVVGYLAYSLTCRLRYGDAPGGAETLVVVVASVLPDVIDKPLAWEFGVVESGYAVGHSVFAALPLAVAAGLLSRRAGRPRLGVAFGLGYLLHLPGDLVLPAVTGRGVPLVRLLWPVATVEAGGPPAGFAEGFLTMVGGFGARLVAGDLAATESAGLGLVGLTFLLWLYDGAPLLRDLLLAAGRAVGRAAGR
ncbi:metal-dependent hydrolase [Salinilacihabitans rarus]|uniref:metal-dependent hydrolase n=1 Tax=Salinilacihabitans rarus TaxID=2961596 RepID=UPI0020C92FFC|nr:metal-dependent hydrolase [Salinilacihabitans rarus]